MMGLTRAAWWVLGLTRGTWVPLTWVSCVGGQGPELPFRQSAQCAPCVEVLASRSQGLGAQRGELGSKGSFDVEIIVVISRHKVILVALFHGIIAW